MPKVTKMTRASVHNLTENIRLAATCTIDERDDKDSYQKFKYAAGKNLNYLDNLEDEFREDIDKLKVISLRTSEFLEKQENLCAELAVKDADGIPQVNESGYYIIEPSSMEEMQSKLAELEAEYPDAQEEGRQTEYAIFDYLKEEIDVKMHCIDFDCVPVRLTGGFADAISPMLKNIPEMD